jgi:hypothetical protein
MSERKPSRREVREASRVRAMAAVSRTRKPWTADPLHARCTRYGNKLRYSTREAAENVLRQIARSGSPKQAASRAYPCDVCGGWHVTSKRRGGR